MVFDFCIVGGGVVGIGILRYLTLSGLKGILIERSEVISGASAKNSGICHSGYDNDRKVTPIENQCVKSGYKELIKLSQRGGLPLNRTGALLCAWNEDEAKKLPEIIKMALENDVFVRFISNKEEMMKLEPNLNPKVLCGVEIPDESIVDPFLTPLAVLIQALRNGAQLLKNNEVTSLKKEKGLWRIKTSKMKENDFIESKMIINCGGLYGDKLEEMSGSRPKFTIKPRKGQFLIMKDSSHIKRVILPVWTSVTKGVLLSPTMYNKMIIGPTAEEQEDRENAKLDKKVLDSLLERGKEICPSIKDSEMIGSYAGLRPATEHKDYMIEFKDQWITVGGIRSTGLSSHLGIAKYIGRKLNYKFIKPKDMIYSEFKSIVNEIMTKFQNNDQFLDIDSKNFPISHPLTQNRFIISKL